MSYIVVYDDGMGLRYTYGFDENCEGALCCVDGSTALFESRKEARRAIRISTAFAKLNQAQGRSANYDFLNELRRVAVVRLVSEESKKKQTNEVIMNDRIKEIAEKIKDALMTTIYGEKGTRLEIKQGATIPEERTIGGLYEGAVLKTIQNVLERELVPGRVVASDEDIIDLCSKFGGNIENDKDVRDFKKQLSTIDVVAIKPEPSAVLKQCAEALELARLWIGASETSYGEVFSKMCEAGFDPKKDVDKRWLLRKIDEAIGALQKRV